MVNRNSNKAITYIKYKTPYGAGGKIMLKQTARRNGVGCGRGNGYAAMEKAAELNAERKAAVALYADDINEFWAAHPELAPKKKH